MSTLAGRLAAVIGGIQGYRDCAAPKSLTRAEVWRPAHFGKPAGSVAVSSEIILRTSVTTVGLEFSGNLDAPFDRKVLHSNT
jgi:hypothetical protein